MLRAGDIDEAFGERWDALPAARGPQADVYDSWAWHAALLHSHPEEFPALRVVSVLDGARPVALLPLTARPGHAWRSAGATLRPRSRLVLGASEPDADVVAAVVDELARSGGRTLELHRLPSRDPGTHVLLDALRAAGYRVAARERSSDRLALVDGGWAGHAAAFKSFAGYAKRFTGRMTALWDLQVHTYGAHAPVSDGFAVYTDLQARSWKGGFDPRVHALRAELLTRAERRDWARIYIVELDGVPVAGHVWFRLGEVATWLSTAYDQSLAVLSPGTVAQWRAQEGVFHDVRHPEPRVVDLLPGGSPQKDRLSPVRPPLLDVDAMRTPIWSGVALPIRHELRRAVPAGRARARVLLRRLRRSAVAAPEAVTTSAIGPAADTIDGTPLDTDAAVRRYLAAVAGEPSAEAVAATWRDDDTWWQVGRGPAALVRIGAAPNRVVREVVRLDSAFGLDDVARALGATVPGSNGAPAVIRVARLPWPSSWRESALTTSKDG
ncbi:MAG TPA: GNAT family N-acetyltransferase [Jiangellaceae bacterium]|nr:GNAT family N-acetyltransferase [Jiangellaceae bacterium]